MIPKRATDGRSSSESTYEADGQHHAEPLRGVEDGTEDEDSEQDE